jgi:hypothetical protein
VPGGWAQVPVSSRSAEDLEVSRPLRLLLTPGWSLSESIRHPGLHRFFQAATWLWAGIFLLLTAGLAAMMVTEPASIFLTLSTVATVALVVAGAAASALWFRRVLRKLGLRVRFAPA